MALVHSYSSVKDFEGCPRRFHTVRILKQFKSKDTEATLYGTAVHKALEDYVQDGLAIPAKFAQFQKFAEPLANMEGIVYCEREMAITSDFRPAEFFGDDAWFRGVPDYLLVDEAKQTAFVVDYKTGKSSRYADKGQLELMAAMTFVHHPEVQVVKGALLFLVVGDIIKAKYTRAELPEILSKWAGRADGINAAMTHGVWNPRASALCRFCPVESCENHG